MWLWIPSYVNILNKLLILYYNHWNVSLHDVLFIQGTYHLWPNLRKSSSKKLTSQLSFLFCTPRHHKMSFNYPLSHKYISCYNTRWYVLWTRHFCFIWMIELFLAPPEYEITSNWQYWFYLDIFLSDMVSIVLSARSINSSPVPDSLLSETGKSSHAINASLP